MTALHRKLIRDLWQMKGQALAIGLVMASGVAMFVMSLSTLESLQESRAKYYDRHRFADVFAQLKRAPNSLTERIAEIPGVARVQTRIVKDVNLDVAGLAEPAVGRLISVPVGRRPLLNDLYLRRGRYLDSGRSGEALVSDAFAQAHRLNPGDHVLAIINGRRKRLRIVGIALSPEYVLQIRTGDFVPDDRRFGVFWMGYEELASAFNMEGAFNDVSLALTPGATEAEVLRRLDRLTETYGGLGAYGREDQVSNRYLSDEMKGLRSMGVIAPLIFLGVAAFLLNVVLNRLITTQRGEIAVLKAFGYTHGEVGLHYLEFTLLLVAVGVVLGTGAGIWLGQNLTEMYARFYRFPSFDYHLSLRIFFLAVLISSAAAMAGVASAVRRAVRLPPAEAMRPEPPVVYRPTIVERWGLQRFFAQPTRMILRHLERWPVKSALSVFGIALAVAILVVGSFMKDALDYIMQFHFAIEQRQDMQVTLVEASSRPALHAIRRLPGVQYAEPFRSVPVKLKFEHYAKRVGIMGLEEGGRLFRLLDAQEQAVTLPPGGLVLSQKLAELLHVNVGETVLVEVLEGERPVREIPVTGVVEEFSGLNAFMSLPALNRLLREGPVISGAFLEVNAALQDTLYHTLKMTPRVAVVTVKEAALSSFRDTVGENFMQMRLFNMIFASIISFGVVYNTARIALSERNRELATLRVIGFTRAEISMILLGEMAFLTLAAIPLGLVLGRGLSALLTRAMDTELYRIPLVIYPATYGLAAAVVLGAALLSALVVRRKLDHLDLVAVLKARE